MLIQISFDLPLLHVRSTVTYQVRFRTELLSHNRRIFVQRNLSIIVVMQNVRAARSQNLCIVASNDGCRVSNWQASDVPRWPPIDRWPPCRILVRTVKLRKQRAVGIELQRSSLVPLAIAEPWPSGPHTALSAARSGHPEIPTHRDAPRPCLC
jgi:hypothetical protein